MNRIRASRWVVVSLLAIAAAGCPKRQEQSPHPPPVRADASWANIVLISIDSLRPDHLGCYGYARNTSPRIDQIAAEGALFQTAVSSTSWTLPAHCALFTGLSDSVHGCQDMDQRLPENRPTMATRLRDMGYATAGFFSGPALHPVFGVAHGFDQYIDCTSFAELSLKLAESGQSLDGGAVEAAAAAEVNSPRVVRNVRTWLDRNQRRPFFLFIHFWDVHFDYMPPPPYDRMFDPDYTGTVTGENYFIDPAINASMPRRDLDHIIALYDGEIAWTDRHVGELLDELDSRGLRETTIVVLLADHGEEFFEHGRKTHRQSLYDEVIRIPLLVRFPGRIAPGQRLDHQARIIDVLPTLLVLAGAPAPDGVMGRSLAGLLQGETLDSRDGLPAPAVSELFSAGRELRSFRFPDRKGIRDLQTGNFQRYDLRSDPAEQSPDSSAALAQRLAEDERQASAQLDRFRGLFPGGVAAPELPDSVRRQLESLGYLGTSQDEEQKDP